MGMFIDVLQYLKGEFRN